MKAFIDDIIFYISEFFSKDNDISKEVLVADAYDSNVKLVPPHIFVQEIDDSDAQEYSSFDGEEISYVPVQITAFCQQMKIGNITYSAKSCSAIFADKIKGLFDIVETVKWNKNIKIMRRVGGTPSIPLQKGSSTYFSPIRYDFYLSHNYEKIYKGDKK